MTKKTALFLAFALALTSFACGKKTDNSAVAPKPADEPAAQQDAAPDEKGPVDLAKQGYPSVKAVVSKAETAEARALLDKAVFSPQGLKAMFSTDGQMTATEYEALVLARGKCLVSQSTGRAHACPVSKNQDLRNLQAGRSLAPEARVAVLERLMGHDDPKVRAAAVEEMLVHAASLPQKDRKAPVEAVVARMKGETASPVIKSALEYAGNARQQRAFRDWQVSLIGSLSDEIRLAAISGDMASRMSEEEIPAYRQALFDRLDDNPLIVQRACEKLGAVALPADVQRLAVRLEPGTDKQIQVGCFRGLVGMWSLQGGEAMVPALKATLGYLKRTPRSPSSPAYQAISGLPGKDSFERVKAKAPYYREQDFIQVLKEVALDDAVDSLVAAEAISKLGGMGAKEALATLADKIRVTANPHLTQAYDEALAAAAKWSTPDKK